MNKYYAPLLLLAAFCLSQAYGEPSYGDAGSSSVTGSSGGGPTAARQNALLAESADGSDGDAYNNDKRVERYAFGLGRRAYTYPNGNSGVKRLPVYNFGLGKRARPYSFGLGKRAGEYDEDANEYDISELERNLGPYAANFLDEKRSRPYSFGLGKREVMEDVDRRGFPNRYGFGLGRR